MKIIRKVFNENDIDNTYNVELNYDEKILNGLLLVMSPAYIKRHKKLLNLNEQVPETKEPVGVSYNFQNGFVIIFLTFLLPNGGKERFQFIVEDTLSVEELFNCNHVILEGMREVIVNAIQMFNMTISDLPDWFDDVQKMKGKY